MANRSEDSDTRNMLARADSALAAELAIRQVEFERALGAANYLAQKAEAFGGGGHQGDVRNLCAQELHRRARMLVDGVMAIHKGASGSAAPDVHIAIKDWIAQRLAEHAQVIQAYLVQPRPAFNETGPPPEMIEELKRETEAALVSVDSAFGQLEQDHVQTALRWVTRAARAIRLLPK
jgi:hypothetical protein